VPVDPKNPAVPANRRAWEGLGRYQKPFLCVFGRNDPVLGRLGHFIQEDQGEELAQRLITWSKA